LAVRLAPRRRLLEGVLTGQAPKAGWTPTELAEIAGVVANGGVDEHLDGVTRLGLLALEENGVRVWRAVQPRPELATALRRVLVVLGETSDAPRRRPRGAARGPRTAAQALLDAERALSAARHELGTQTVDELLELLAQVGRRLRELG
jgi:hypothetical protein